MDSIDKFCDAMRWAADSDQVGYSQSDRWGVVFYGDGEYNADCSSLVIQALRYAGFETGNATYTGNMSANLCANGWTRLDPGYEWLRGDILLNDGNHVAVWLGDCIAQASIDENGGITGGEPGDQTGAEVNTTRPYSYPWNCILRYMETEPEKEVDMSKGCIIRPNQENYLVWFDGCELHELHNPDEVTAIDMVYQAMYGEGCPRLEMGNKRDPWATRFFDACQRKIEYDPKDW